MNAESPFFNTVEQELIRELWRESVPLTASFLARRLRVSPTTSWKWLEELRRRGVVKRVYTRKYIITPKIIERLHMKEED